MPADASAPLLKKIISAKASLIEALSGSDFYIELACIAFALTLAWLMATLIRSRTASHLQKHPPKHIDAVFIRKPLALAGPLLALIYLSAVEPFARTYAHESEWTKAVIHLCVAYLLAKCVVLIVRTRPVALFIAFIILSVAVLDVTGFTKSTLATLDALAFDVGKFKISLLSLIHGVVIFVIVFWIAGILSRTLESFLRRSSALSYNARELFVKFFKIFIYFIAFVITLSAIGVDLTALAVFGGALGVGIGLGLQKITSNFVSGVTLLLEKSIKIGDLIEIGGTLGWVRQLNIRYALMETHDGRELLIPNEELITTRVTNWTYTSDMARVEIKLTICYDADAVLARELMLQAVKSYKPALKKPEPFCYLREFGDSGLNFALTFWIADIKEGRNGPQSDVLFAILEKFRRHDIRVPALQHVAMPLGGKTQPDS